MKRIKLLLVSCICIGITFYQSIFNNVHAVGSEGNTIVTKTLYYNLSILNQDVISRASTTYTRHNVDTFSQTVRGLKMSANVTLKVTIRVNENTGVITSFDGPYLNQNWVEVGAYQGYITDISTNAEFSESHRSLYCQGSFKIFAETAIGADPHYTSSFTIKLTAQ